MKHTTAEDIGIKTRSEMEQIILSARKGKGSGNPNGYVREPQNAIRDAALLAFEFEAAKRVSEFTGRKYFDDVYAGLTMEHIRYSKTGSTEVLQFKVRILKRGRRKKECLRCKKTSSRESQFCRHCGASLKNAELVTPKKQIWKWKDLRTDSPFFKYIKEWLDYLTEMKYDGRVFAITRQRAWQIMKNLGLTNHANRHIRTTHQSSTMNAFELKEFLDRATIPTEYVHSEPIKQLQKTKEADQKWT